jgi:hypothetical protein
MGGNPVSNKTFKMDFKVKKLIPFGPANNRLTPIREGDRKVRL